MIHCKLLQKHHVTGIASVELKMLALAIKSVSGKIIFDMLQGSTFL